MPDPADPTQPPPPSSPEPELRTTSTSTGLPSNVAAAIACIPLIGGIIFYILEKRDSFARFYAMQSIIFSCTWLLFNIVWLLVWLLFNIVSAGANAVVGAIPGMGGILVFFWAIIAVLVHLVFLLVMIIANLAFLVVTIIAIVKAFTGVRWDIPYVGPIARRQVEGAGG